MSHDLKKRIHLLCRYCTTVLIIIIAVMLVVGCIRIYQTGDRPFTREVIAQTASRIAIPGYLCLLTIIAGLLLSNDEQKRKPDRDVRYQLLRLECRTKHADPQQYKAIQTQRRLRLYYRIGTGILIALLLLYPLFYFMDPSHFSISDLTRDIIQAVLVSMIPAAIALILIYICSVLEDAGIRREIEILKSIENKDGSPTIRQPKCRLLFAARCLIFVLAAMFIILGIDNGGIGAVLGKAIRICTECIGLG